jgi:uncharacterized protein YecT (DUF1311 family)
MIRISGSALVPMVALIAICWAGIPEDAWAANQDCTQAVSSAEMLTCANQRYEAADAELNRIYQHLASHLSQQRRGQLKAAQKAWIVFRDHNAAFVAGTAEGGTQYPILEVSELAVMTKERTEQLNRRAVSPAETLTGANQRYEAADAELNRIYQHLASQLPQQRRGQLKAAQKAWIVFRDHNAAFVAGTAEGGTQYPILEVLELAAMTEQRTEQLKAHIE